MKDEEPSRDALADRAFSTLLEHFDEIAIEVWNEVIEITPPEFLDQVRKLEFLILDEPTPDMIRDLPEDLAAYPEEICGLHVGTPITEELITHPSIEPTKIYLFRLAILGLLEEDEIEDLEAALREEIAVTLIHEIGHYFGLYEDDMERLGYD
jgi:predicted Zn-dependent protease with MMP-like domain